ncbi:hypothetical protein DUNSADRAFT_11980 [Dunaliella salina]|uniref:Uncharacterized protein n=1 Tax=Dunaliella salina TaxID=3046 RepID=A0ABQ7GC84_DUNSA|nr:hypothetical protein DUNSADRAFT_11980 [Dunaliella salina]|eukprot:KAF5832223.1 hypothetical protein DUNSADRAFT_11980 [Dunaliella salina]
MEGPIKSVVGALGVPLLHRVMQQSATLPDGFRGSGNKDNYYAWTWDTYHRGFMRPAVVIAVVHLLLILRDLEGTVQRLVNLTMLLQMICLFVLTLKLPPNWKIQAHVWARWVVVSFVLGRIFMTWVLTLSDEHPGQAVVRLCEKWLDTVTNIGITVPALALSNFTTGAWLVFLGLHISASAPFYVKWLNYSAAWAVFKDVVIQCLGLLVYAIMERNKSSAFVKSGEQALRKKLATLADVPLHVGGVASDSAATPKQDTLAVPSTKQSIGAAERSSSVQELDQSAPCLQIASQRMYTSRLKKKKVMLKVHCDIEPNKLLAGFDSGLLQSFLKSSLQGSLIVESAVRRGCIIVSIDLCEPMRIDDEASLLSSSATEHEVASKVAGSMLKWLHASHAQGLKDGTLLSIQVNNFTFKGCWDASTNSVRLEGMDTLPTKKQYSITQSQPAVLLPAFQPMQQQQSSSVCFLANVSSPKADELVGWQGNGATSHAVQGVGKGEGGVLQLLAHTRGMFLPLEVAEVGRAANGDRTVQVCVSLPPGMHMHGECLRLELELVKKSTLLSSSSVLLLGSHLSEALHDLKGWAVSTAHAPEAVGVFLEDLAEFLSFQGLVAPSPISTVESGSSSHSSSTDMPSEKSLLSVLKAEAQTSEMLNMMAEVGLELLQHAVSWGMAALAQQLLTGLMAVPLCVPFQALACGKLPHTHPFTKEGTQQRQQQHQQQQVQEQRKELGNATVCELDQHVQQPSSETAAASDVQLSDDSVQGQDRDCLAAAGLASPCSSRTLITCALLSYDKQCLARVLEWGRMYGGLHGFAWPWSAVDASGYSPLQIMQRLPAGHAVLEQLLADPTTRPAALHAQDLAHQASGPAERDSAKSAAHPSSVRAQRHPGSVGSSSRQGDELAGGKVQAGSSKAEKEEGSAVGHPTSSPQPAPTSDTCHKCAFPNCVLKVALKALVLGFGNHGDITEADFRDWCFKSTTGYANVWCCLVVLLASYTLVTCLSRGLLLNAVALCLYPVFMSLALFAESTRMRKVYMNCGKTMLWAVGFIFSVGFLPSLLAQKLALMRLDWAVEVVLYRLVYQVQLKDLLLERMISCVNNTCMYARLGFSFPLGRALTLSLCSLLVGLALDVRNRCIFLKFHALSAAGLDGSHGKVAQVQQAFKC